MKSFVALLVVTSICVLVFFSSVALGTLNFSKDKYVNQQLLDTASPFNVTIDTELIKKLVPAYEQ